MMDLLRWGATAARGGEVSAPRSETHFVRTLRHLRVLMAKHPDRKDEFQSELTELAATRIQAVQRGNSSRTSLIAQNNGLLSDTV